ncbi:MAG: YybS family protein [Candidatus Caldatribacterium sp.]|nr:YybS family protein [Candidatus Caldatribacterium sp.]
MRSIRPTVEGAFLAALTVILYLASIYIPILGVFVSFLCPLPVMFLVIRWGARVGILASFVASALVFTLAGLMQAVTCLVGFSLLGIAMGVTVRRRYALPEILILNTGVSLLSKLALVGIALIVAGKNPLVENIRLLEETLKRTPWIPQNLPGTEGLLELVQLIMPALLLVASLFDTGCNFLLGRWIGKRLGLSFPEIPPFSEWRLPRSVFWVFVLGWVFVLFGGPSVLGKIGINLQIVTQLLFLFQGLSLVYYFLGRYIRSKAVRVGILAFLMFQPLLSSLLSWLGVFDVFFDFRRLGTKQ